MNGKELFDTKWRAHWFTSEGLRIGTLSYSSFSIQSLHKLMYMAIDELEEALTVPD